MLPQGENLYHKGELIMPRKMTDIVEGGPPLVNVSRSSTNLGAERPEALGEEGTLLEELASSEGSVGEGSPEPLTEADAADAALASQAETPRDEWLEDLRDNNVTPLEASAILDHIMTKGYYAELYRMGGTQFRFRTRTTVDADRTIELLQEAKPESTGVYGHIISRINLACSLVSYGNHTFPHTAPTDDNREALDKEWRERYRFCSTLPAPAFYALTQVLQKFDNKVALSSDSRSLENF